MKKKGITLIEIVIAMALAFIMVGVIDRMLVSYLKNYRNSVVQNKGFNYLSESIAVIEREVNQNARSVKVEGNIIKINYTDEITLNYIKCINSSLYILYGTKYSMPKDNSYKSLIIDDVKDFIAIKTGKILYIKVVWNNNQNIERCLSIENAS